MAAKKVDEIFVGITGSAAGLVKAVQTSVVSLQGLSSQILSLPGILSASAAGAGVGWAIKLAADAEQAQTAFEVMLGSGEKAEAMLADLKKYANVSPFSLVQVREGAQLLLNYGVAGADILPTMQMLGDIAAGDGVKLEGLSRAFGQMNAAGKITGGDLLQMINAGFNPLKVLAEATGESMTSLKTRMEQGKLGVDELNKAIKIATSVGGQFYGMTEKQSKTTAGLFSSAMDVMQNSATAFGKILIKAFNVNNLLDSFNNSAAMISDVIESWTPAAEMFQAAFMNTMADAQQVIGNFTNSCGGVGSIMGILADVAASFGKIGYAAFYGIEAVAGGVLGIMSAIVRAWTFLTTTLGTKPDYSFADALLEERNKLVAAAEKGFDSILDTALPSEEINKRMQQAMEAGKVIKQVTQDSKSVAAHAAGADEYAKIVAKLKEQIEVFGQGEHALERLKLAQQGISDAELSQLSILHAQLDAMEEQKKIADDRKSKAKQIIEDLKSPFEKARDEFHELKIMYDQGLIGQKEFLQASKKLDQGLHIQAPKLVLSGSQEARQARLEQTQKNKKGKFEQQALSFLGTIATNTGNTAKKDTYKQKPEPALSF